jgi:hypothetical protein
MGADCFLFSERFAVLADGHPGDDREALRSFAVLHDVRRFDLVSISLFALISDAVSSNAQPLQSDRLPSAFISTLTVPADVMYLRSRGTRGGLTRDLSQDMGLRGL